MNVFELTRALVDIDSVTPNEEQVGMYLADRLSRLASRTNGHVERIEVEPHRFNVLATWGQPIVTFSTHMDTVPPFFASREDDEWIWGRGACDTKGIIASMISPWKACWPKACAASRCCSWWARSATARALWPPPRTIRGSRFMINGEPTENKLALGSKGALRYEIVARGRMAHSAYPHLGESAIEKLLDALERVRRIPLPHDPLLGASTLNIGTIQGGRAPNVIPDHARRRFSSVWWIPAIPPRRRSPKPSTDWRRREKCCAFPRCTWARWMDLRPRVVSYTTDIPGLRRRVGPAVPDRARQHPPRAHG